MTDEVPIGVDEVLRAFVIADRGKPPAGQPPEATLQRILTDSNDVQTWPHERLAAAVTDEGRRNRYLNCEWVRTCLAFDALAVWPMMGGLPADLSEGSAAEVAARIGRGGGPVSSPRLTAMLGWAESEPASMLACCLALPMIAYPYAYLHGHDGRPGWALDDGSHRCVVAALLRGGEGTVITYVGTPIDAL